MRIIGRTINPLPPPFLPHPSLPPLHTPPTLPLTSILLYVDGIRLTYENMGLTYGHVEGCYGECSYNVVVTQ